MPGEAPENLARNLRDKIPPVITDVGPGLVASAEQPEAVGEHIVVFFPAREIEIG